MKSIRCASVLLVFAGAMHSAGCVLVKVREQSRVVSRDVRKLSMVPTALPVIRAIEAAGAGSVRLAVQLRDGVHLKRAHTVEREFIRSRGPDFEFLFFYFAFATPEKGVGDYLGKLLLGIPFTLGINLMVAAGDWLSLPFRLRSTRETRIEYRPAPALIRTARGGRTILYFAGERHEIRDDRVLLPAAKALRLAVRLRDDSSARRLAAKADINHDYGAGNTLLHFAAIRGDASAIRLLLKLGARPDARNRSGRTPLHFAARRFSPICARLLLDAGASPNARDGRGRSPLFEAVAPGNESMLRLLLERGASTESRDAKGQRPADLLRDYPFSNRETLLRLLNEK